VKISVESLRKALERMTKDNAASMNLEVAPNGKVLYIDYSDPSENRMKISIFDEDSAKFSEITRTDRL
jgi:hypothetical protein